MISDTSLARLHRLIWALIYGGLLVLITGLSVHRLDAGQGWTLAIAGGAMVLLGGVLIAVRARLRPDARPPR